MDNFEKRYILLYIDRLINYIDFRNYNFEDFFYGFTDTFNVNRNLFKFDSDNSLLVETPQQRTELKKTLKEIVSKLKQKIKPVRTKFEQKFLLFKDIYKLNDNEYQCFIYLVLQEVNSVFSYLDTMIMGNGFYIFSKNYLKIRNGEREEILNNLYLSRLITSKTANPSVNSDIVKIFENSSIDTNNKVTSALLGTPEKTELTLKDFNYLEKENDKVIKILKSAIENNVKGVNILLYGSVGQGKTEISKVLSRSAGLKLYSVKTEKDNRELKREERLTDLNAKLQILNRTGKSVVLFDEAEDVLNRGWGENGTASKGYLNRLLENVAVPVLWTTNDIYSVDSAFLRRMTYAVEFNELSEQTRLNIWNKTIKKNGLKVSKEKIEELNKSYNVSPSIITNAVTTTKMINGDENDFEDLIESVAKVVHKKSEVKEEKKEENTLGDYDISLVNVDMDIADLTEKIKQSGKMNFSLCLYGISGSGKSRYALHLAEQLGIKATIKKVSDLISCYVGDTEKNISEAFKECEKENSMLILDECDSFLQDRSNAIRSWEISQVNELLVNMENAKIPFVATTNLMDTLDQASLRRFTFKVSFSYMNKEQAKQAFKHFFNLKSDFYIKGLCCGDFATVKKKTEFLNIADSPTITKMLREEVGLKNLPELKKNNVGF